VGKGGIKMLFPIVAFMEVGGERQERFLSLIGV
jgi:hypothetical protein